MTFTGLLILALGLLFMAVAIEPALRRWMRRKGNRGFARTFLPPALQYPKYRAYWLGMLAAVSGYQMFRVAQLWLIYEITDSPWFLGYAGVANALPGMLFNLFGGVFADKLDKRILIVALRPPPPASYSC